MDFLSIFIWICPVITIAIAFFTSGITRFRLQRYLAYVFVLFIAFLFDLQSLSFRADMADIVHAQCTLLILADFFWRGVRMKNRILRFGSLVLGIVFLFIAYQEWFVAGPQKLHHFFDASVSDTSPAKLGQYYVKIRGIFKARKSQNDKIVLFRKRNVLPLEQKLAEFQIPEGYENAVFSYKWEMREDRIAVSVIGDADTLWMLADPGPPK